MNSHRYSAQITLAALKCVLFCVAANAAELAVATNGGGFLDYNTLTGAYTLITTEKTVLYGMGYSATGTLYANDDGSSPNVGFYSVNPSTGALTLIANLQGSIFATGTLAAPISGGTLYYFDRTNNLFTINPSNGVVTTVGPLGFSVSGNFDIAFGPDGNLYGTSSGSLYRINPVTGAGTFIAADGEFQALIAGDGQLYGFSGTHMYSINLTNGAAAFVQNTPGGIGDFEAGVAVFAAMTSAPEPAALFFVLCGAAILSVATLKNSGKPTSRSTRGS
jgi:hypothetical protein